MNKLRLAALAAFFVPSFAIGGAPLPPGVANYALQLNGNGAGQTNVYAFTESGSSSTWGADLNSLMASLPYGGTVLLGTGIFHTQTSIIIPGGITLRGAGKRGTIISASGRFPSSSSPSASQALVQLGNNSINFDSKIEDLWLGYALTQGQECLYITGANEGTAAKNIGCSNFDYYGIWFDGQTHVNTNAGPFEGIEILDAFHTNAFAYGGGSGNRYAVYFNSPVSERIELRSFTMNGVFGSGIWSSSTIYTAGQEVYYVCSSTYHIFYALSGSTNVTPICGQRRGTWSDTGQSFTAGFYIGGGSSYGNLVSIHSMHCENSWDCISVNGIVAGTIDTVDAWGGMGNAIIHLMSGSNFTGLNIRGIMNAHGTPAPYTIQDSVNSVNYTGRYVGMMAPALILNELPTSCTSQPAGTVWNNSNVLNICP